MNMYLYICFIKQNKKIMANTSYTHLQIQKENKSIIYVVETSKVCIFIDELIINGIDISSLLLLKVI